MVRKPIFTVWNNASLWNSTYCLPDFQKGKHKLNAMPQQFAQQRGRTETFGLRYDKEWQFYLWRWCRVLFFAWIQSIFGTRNPKYLIATSEPPHVTWIFYSQSIFTKIRGDQLSCAVEHGETQVYGTLLTPTPYMDPFRLRKSPTCTGPDRIRSRPSRSNLNFGPDQRPEFDEPNAPALDRSDITGWCDLWTVWVGLKWSEIEWNSWPHPLHSRNGYSAQLRPNYSIAILPDFPVK